MVGISVALLPPNAVVGGSNLRPGRRKGPWLHVSARSSSVLFQGRNARLRLEGGPSIARGLQGTGFAGGSRDRARKARKCRNTVSIFEGQSSENLRATGTGQDAGIEYDLVTEVLRDKPSQVEPKFLIGGRLYSLKEKQLMEASFWRKLTRAVGMLRDTFREGKERLEEAQKKETEEEEEERREQRGLQQDVSESAERVGEDAKPARPVYISELLREYKGNLYVPEEAFSKPVSELEEFNRSLDNLPEMSVEQFLKAVKANQVHLLTSRGVSTPRGKYTYWDFVVELKKIPGEQSLQRRKWAMHLNDEEAKTLLRDYSGPQREVETSVTPYIVPPTVVPHPVAESISGRVIMELTVVASIIWTAAFAVGGMASVALFTLASASSVIIVHVLWPIASPLVRPFFFLAMRVLGGVWSIFTMLVTGGGAGRKGIPALLLEGYRYLTSGALYSSARTLGAILFVLVAMAALAKFTLTRRPKDFTKWDLWQAIDFGHSKPQARVEGTTGVGFADVAGINDVVEELQELVSYLKDPERFNQMGTKPPHGVLLEGPPGCGKTLLAKAIAGEAGVPFYQMAGSEFVEVLVGVGAARIRDLFKRAKVNRPSVVFIDEIDALGAMRNAATGEEGAENYNAGAQERETTLNQLLIELDGFDTGKGVVFLGATNRMDMLDPALLRPGRFDRKIAIRPPRAKGRLEILKVHAKSVRLSPTVDLWLYAKNLPGWTGAELAQLLQEAALVAVRHGGSVILRPDMDQALDRLTMGPERLGLERRQPVHRRMATHEVGMAMASHILRRVENGETEFCDRVSIVPRGETLSRTIFERLDDEAYLFNKRPSLIHRLKVLLAGRAAEEVIYGRDTSTFSEQHLADASWLARKLITIWNLDGPITMHGDRNPWVRAHGFSGPPLGFEGGLYDDYGLVDKPLNYALCDNVAARTKHLLDTSYREIFSLLQQHQAAMAKAIYVVMDREEVFGEELDYILDKYPSGTPLQLVEDEDEPGELQMLESQDEGTHSRRFDSSKSTTYSPTLVIRGDEEFSRGPANGKGNGERESRLTMPTNGNGNGEKGGHLYMAEDLARIDGDVVAAASRSSSGEASCDGSSDQGHTVASGRAGKGDAD